MRRILGALTAIILIAGAGTALAQEPDLWSGTPGRTPIQCVQGMTDGTVVYVELEVTDATLVARDELCAAVSETAIDDAAGSDVASPFVMVLQPTKARMPWEK